MIWIILFLYAAGAVQAACFLNYSLGRKNPWRAGLGVFLWPVLWVLAVLTVALDALKAR
jgi:hypothetical protein